MDMLQANMELFAWHGLSYMDMLQANMELFSVKPGYIKGKLIQI